MVIVVSIRIYIIVKTERTREQIKFPGHLPSSTMQGDVKTYSEEEQNIARGILSLS
jgi:hypothetical protein